MINVQKMIIFTAIIFSLLLLLIFTMLFERSFFGTKTYSLKIDDLERTYNVHLPKGYGVGNKYPLVIVLHGLSDNPTLVELNSGMSKKADREKFIALYPKGTGKSPSWNAQFCCGEARKNKVDDVKFIDSLIKTAILDFAVDKNRIFVVGFSNGGMMAYRLAAELSNIKGVGIIAGTAGSKSDMPSAPNRDVATIVFHGENDKSVPLRGGGEFSFLSVDLSLDIWTGGKYDKTIEENEIFTKTMYKRENKQDVVLYVVKGRSHVWFGGLQDYIYSLKRPNIFATDIIWSFLKP